MSGGRVINFSAGPSKVPTEVLERVKQELLNYNGEGMSVMELSHRSAAFAKIVQEAEQDVRDLLDVPSNYKVLFMHGGGTGQFAAIPLNICPEGSTVDYFVTGGWSAKAAKEAEKYCKVNKVLPKTDKYTGIADPSTWKLSPNAAYVYYCANETIHGVEFHSIPEISPSIPLICDMSSNIFTKPVDVSKYGIIFAGAQKNIGAAGVTLVIVRDDLIGKARTICPSILEYKVNAENNSLYNTPATFSLYVCGLVLKWIKEKGGIEAMERNSIQKSKLVYDTIKESKGFYYSHIEEAVRSRMTIPFRVGGPDGNDNLEKKFLAAAQKRGMSGLKGHRSVGGIRIAVFNAMSIEETQQLISFMKDFASEHNH
ncbi:probable phosphoserine aminotransferase [Centruroides vittatus]|uniref:probable phosphoserine aminotransferase n=1 Tax=Centruroides vittatus TaxID=120091 RepID=UPI003510AB40